VHGNADFQSTVLRNKTSEVLCAGFAGFVSLFLIKFHILGVFPDFSIILACRQNLFVTRTSTFMEEIF
jgi:hypothetical protein